MSPKLLYIKTLKLDGYPIATHQIVSFQVCGVVVCRGCLLLAAKQISPFLFFPPCVNDTFLNLKGCRRSKAQPGQVLHKGQES